MTFVGNPEGAIALRSFRELWIHTGTACNLECPFCLEGSKPGDARLERLNLNELKPFLDEAVQLDVQRFCFTGGEPLIVKDIVKILSYALQSKPCLVLTNGTAPLIKRVHQLQLLGQQPHALSFCISLDHPDEQQHDLQRGWGNFKRAIEGLKLLQQAGFPVCVARHAAVDEDAAAIDTQYDELLRKHEIRASEIIALPELGRPALPSSETPPEFTANPPLCASSRMLLKKAGTLRVFACPLTDDDDRFDLGSALKPALQAGVRPIHHRCGQCARFGVNLGGRLG